MIAEHATRLTDRYDFLLPMESIEAAAAELERSHGLKLAIERREVDILHISPASAEPGPS